MNGHIPKGDGHYLESAGRIHKCENQPDLLLKTLLKFLLFGVEDEISQKTGMGCEEKNLFWHPATFA